MSQPPDSETDKKPLNEVIKQLLAEGGDFGHEMRVAGILRNIRLPQFHFRLIRLTEPEHGGTYIDQITGKPRQFDFRASIASADGAITQQEVIHFAIECKNISPDFPIILQGTQRSVAESRHEYLVRALINQSINIRTHSEVGNRSIYPPDKFVGKSIVKIKKRGDGKNGMVFDLEGDADIYDRWAQALSSCSDLVKKVLSDDSNHSKRVVVLPLVVVPNKSLWRAEYDESGAMQGEPVAVDECELFVDRHFKESVGSIVISLNVTHIHFVTLTGLERILGLFTTGRDTAYTRTAFGKW